MKPTDTEILDWILKSRSSVYAVTSHGNQWTAGPAGHQVRLVPTPREACLAAMAEETERELPRMTDTEIVDWIQKHGRCNGDSSLWLPLASDGFFSLPDMSSIDIRRTVRKADQAWKRS